MQSVQIDAPFEIRKMDLREFLPSVFEIPFLMLRDNRGRWIIDPYLVGIDHATALKQAHRRGQPIYDLESHIFAELHWLLSEAMKPYRKTLPTKDGDKTIPFEKMAEMFTSLAEKSSGESVSVKMIRREPDVFSEH